MTVQRPEIDVIVFITGLQMDGSGIEKVFGFSTSGITIPYSPELYNRALEAVISQPIISTESMDGPTFGNVVLANDGRLNHLINYSFGDRPIEVYLVRNGDYATRSPLFFGLVDRVVVGYEVDITVKDILSLLDAAVVRGKFSGDNILPYGIEGDRDMEGQTKPRVIGKVFNVSPTLINSAKLIYGINWDRDGSPAALYEITEIRDKGVPLPIEGDVATSVDLQNTSVTNGYVKTCLAEGMFRTGSIPVGGVTADAQAQSDISMSAVIYSLCLEAGFTEKQLQNLAGVVEGFTCPVGTYATSEMSYRGIVDAILQPIETYIWADQTNNVWLGKRGVPIGTEERLTLIEHRGSALPTDQLPIISARVTDQTYPMYRLELHHSQNFTVQGQDELAWSSREQWGKFTYQWTTVEDLRQYVKEIFLEARQEDRDTALICSSEAESLTAGLLDELQYPHQIVTATVNLSDRFSTALSDMVASSDSVTLDSIETTVDSNVVTLDLVDDFVTYLPASAVIQLGDFLGLQSPYVPDCHNIVYQVTGIETNARRDDLVLTLEGRFGTVIFRGIATPIIGDISPEEFCYKVPPPALHSSDFATIDLGEPHVSSDWQIAEDQYFYLLKDQVKESTTELLDWQPTRTLDPNKKHYARVRYRTATYRSRWSEPFEFILRYRVEQPVVTYPTEALELVNPDDMPVTITTSAFVPLIAGLTHASTNWLIYGSGTSRVLITDDTVNLTSLTMSFRAGTVYIKAQYKADTGCLSAWSQPRKLVILEGDCSNLGDLDAPVETLPLDGETVTS